MRKYFTLFVFFALVGASNAISIGAGPSSLEFLNVNKGGYAEKNLVVYTESEENLTVKIEATGPIAEWLSLNETIFVLPAGGRKEVKATITPSITTPNGLYNGKIHFYAALEKEVGNETNFQTKGGTSILATVRITGEKQYNYVVDSVSVKEIEVEYPIKINVSITNTGNVNVVPQFTIKVYNETKNLILEENYSDSEVLPTTTRHIQITLRNKTLDAGLYWVDLSWDLGGLQSIGFEVLEKGALAVYGKLTELKLDRNIVQENDVVKVDAKFENAGEEFIDQALLKLEVYSKKENTNKNELVGVTQTEPYSIPLHSTREITAYYTPKKVGSYVLRGYVVYSGKKTRFKEVELEVLEKPKNYLIYYVLLGIVFILVSYYLMKRKKEGFIDDPTTQHFKENWQNYIKR